MIAIHIKSRTKTITHKFSSILYIFAFFFLLQVQHALSEKLAILLDVDGELWRATSPIPLRKEEKVKIIKIKGLELSVTPLNQKGTTHV